MSDTRINKLAKLLIDYSLGGITKGEKLWLRLTGPEGAPLALEVYKQAILKGAIVDLDVSLPGSQFIYYRYSKPFQLSSFPEIAEFKSKWADKRLVISAEANTRELTNVESSKIMIRNKAWEPLWKRLLEIPWCLVDYPTNAMAQEAKMSLEEMQDFVFGACLVDWGKIDSKGKSIKKIIDNAKKIQIVGKETNLTMSFSGRYFNASNGKKNMPDGEVFGAPLDLSVEGKIYYEFPSVWNGNEVKGIRLEFKKGKVVRFSAEDNEKFLKAAIETDEGSCRLGELGIGINYKINRFINNILFDEKIGGTIHTALGKAYDEKEGGGRNKSAIHWDLVKDMRGRGSMVLVNGKILMKEGKIIL